MKIAALFLLMAVACATSPLTGAEAPVTVTEQDVAEALKFAPQCPHVEGMDLNLRLIDYINCADPQDPHDMMDQGTSSVVMTPLGDYRTTAAHRHAFFAYRFRSAGRSKPVLVVFEYPDNAERTINFSTHESALSGGMNHDWSLETGVYTGGPFPLSNESRYHTFIMWPQDQWPVAMVGNFHRYGHPAAASRIWVYAIEGGLPKLDVEAPDGADQRRLGHFNSFAFLPTDFHFGYRGPSAIEHMLDYAEYVGVNELAWVVMANNAWGAWADVPSFRSTGDREHLDRVLAAMDKRGGFSFAACVAPEADATLGGATIAEMDAEELKTAVTVLLDEFLDRYGTYESLRAIGLGAQYSPGFCKRLDEAGVLAEVVSHIKRRRPDLQVFTFLGGEGLHKQYFDGSGPSALSVVEAFEAGEGSWPEVLAAKAAEAWRAWGQDPADWKAIDGLDIYEQYQPDDFRIFGLYSQQPREMMYFDLDASAARSDLIDTPYAALWNTHFEGWYGLHPEVNFWYRKLWVAPDFNAPGELSAFPFARAMGHRDRLAILAGSWNNKFFGHEKTMRRFAKAFRSLPPKAMAEVTDLPLDTVEVRWTMHAGRRYVAVQSLIPFASKVTVDGEEMDLAPYELATIRDDGDGAPTVTGQAPPEYMMWVGERLLTLSTLQREVAELDPDAAGDAYKQLAETAAGMMMRDKYYALDQMIGWGLIGELELRKSILDPPTMTAPKMADAPPMNGDLDAWDEAAGDIVADDGSYLAGHLFFPNSWGGPADLSARLRLGHDGQTLYIGAAIRDDKLTAKDSCTFRLSLDGAYRDWSGRTRSNLHPRDWPITLPADGEDITTGEGFRGFRYTCRRTADGYVVEGSAPLAELGVGAGESMGFLLMVQDDDGTGNLYTDSWARKQAMLVPHKPNFTYYSDVRTLGRLELGE